MIDKRILLTSKNCKLFYLFLSKIFHVSQSFSPFPFTKRIIYIRITTCQNSLFRNFKNSGFGALLGLNLLKFRLASRYGSPDPPKRDCSLRPATQTSEITLNESSYKGYSLGCIEAKSRRQKTSKMKGLKVINFLQ